MLAQLRGDAVGFNSGQVECAGRRLPAGRPVRKPVANDASASSGYWWPRVVITFVIVAGLLTFAATRLVVPAGMRWALRRPRRLRRSAAGTGTGSPPMRARRSSRICVEDPEPMTDRPVAAAIRERLGLTPRSPACVACVGASGGGVRSDRDCWSSPRLCSPWRPSSCLPAPSRWRLRRGSRPASPAWRSSLARRRLAPPSLARRCRAPRGRGARPAPAPRHGARARAHETQRPLEARQLADARARLNEVDLRLRVPAAAGATAADRRRRRASR